MYFYNERIEETIKVLKQNKDSDAVPVDRIGFSEGCATAADVSFTKTYQDYSLFLNGAIWSGVDSYAVFRVDVVIPEKWEHQPVMLRITTGRESGWEALNPQFIVWTEKGLKQGIDVNHREILLDESAEKGKTYKVLLEGWTGLEAMDCFFKVEANCINREAEALYYDFLAARDAVFLPEQSETERVKMLEVLMPIVNSVYLYQVPSEEFYSSISTAHRRMEEEFFAHFAGNDITVFCTGHSHIDVAWQWEVRHSRKKAVRSFASAIDHMEQYPDFVFSSSQPQLYSFIKQDYPEFYEKIKQKMAQDRFEAEGAMWLEADCNLISGESFVRQLVHGKQFFKQEFGIDSRVLWLPDVFGYSAVMPQLLKLCGVDYFVTSKISWNEYNRMPHDVFYWVGIDGSRILTYLHTMPDADNTEKDSYFATYSGQILPHTVRGTWSNFKDKELTKNVLASYGFGDGGGGPTRNDLEYAARLARGLPGVPCVKQSRIRPFFENLEQELSEKAKVPMWNGELYLEFHRGTYTSVALIKKYNRLCEIALHDLELTGVMAGLYVGLENYPYEEIGRMWETVLLNQFHDILPGSSIGKVYETSFKEYEEILKTASELKEATLLELCGEEDRESVTAYNMLPFDRDDILIFEEECEALILPSGVKQTVQKTFDQKYLAWVPDIKSFGHVTLKKSMESSENFESSLGVNGSQMKNKFFTVKFDDSFQLASIYDKLSDREVLTDTGNVLRVFEDRPRQYDAWEITSYYRDKEQIINQVHSFQILEQGPVRAGVEIVRRFLDSTITQRIFIYQHLPRIDFETEIEWKEKQLLLKAGFPIAVHSDFATFDIAFGNVRRTTHMNTSWDFAQFEVCAHKWADYSERGYGVALLNNCKYGYRVKDGMLEITLLKSASFPYKNADYGKHSFCYSLFPHSGDFAEGKVEQQAWMLNSLLYPSRRPVREDLPNSLFTVEDSNLYMDTVKLSYQKDGVIVRLHEFVGRRTASKLSACRSLKAAYLCDLLENEIEELPFLEKEVSLIMSPYEIKTIKLLFGGEDRHGTN